MPDTAAALISAFTTGRLTYEQLSERLTAIASGSDATVADIRKSIIEAEEAGRLPFDLGAILRNLFPAGPEPVAAIAGLADEDDAAFEEPTVPLLNKVVAEPAPQASVSAHPLPPVTPPSMNPPGLAISAPPQPPVPSPAVNPPGFDDLNDKVDDAVLSSLIGEFRDLRNNRKGGRQAGNDKPDALDGLLSNFKTARYRSNARRASRGDAVGGLNLAGLDDFHGKRAGIGAILRDRFILDREVGRGGMGVVYAAVDRRRLEAASGEPYVALKLLNDDIRTNSEALRLLEAEARKAQSLAHPNIATVYDFDRHRSEVFIVMELLSGMPLSRLLAGSAGQPLPAAQIAAILRGTCAGLSHAHARSVVHSDLKPGNIFVAPTNEVKLIDFGLATAAHTTTSAESGGMTITYASPEMFENAPRDPRDDVFALGCIAYQLITGLHPFRMQPIDEVAKAGVRPEPILDIDGVAWQTIESALAFEREARLASVEAFMAGIFDS